MGDKLAVLTMLCLVVGGLIVLFKTIGSINRYNDKHAWDVWQARQQALYTERDAEFDRRARVRESEFEQKRLEAADEFERNRLLIAAAALSKRQESVNEVERDALIVASTAFSSRNRVITPEAEPEPVDVGPFVTDAQIQASLTSINLPLASDLESMGVYLSEEESEFQS